MSDLNDKIKNTIEEERSKTEEAIKASTYSKSYIIIFGIGVVVGIILKLIF
jgi:hypothetical protein